MPTTVFNKYTYVSNSPLNYTDPTGKFIFTTLFFSALIFNTTSTLATTALIGAVAGLATLEASYGFDTEKMIKKTTVGEFFGAALLGALGGIGGAALGGYVAGAATASPALNATVANIISGGITTSFTSVGVTGALDLGGYVNGVDYGSLFLWSFGLGGTLGYLAPNSTFTNNSLVLGREGGIMFFSETPVPEDE